MKYKKCIILMVLAIFILCAASVSASDEYDTALASEDEDSMELSANDEMHVEYMQASEEDDESIGVSADTEELSISQGNYSELSKEIGSGGNIELKHDYYTYDSGSTIEIKTPNSVIDGKGAVIDMAGTSNRAFVVSADGVTIKNLTIKNARNGNADGIAIFFRGSGTLINCNFTNNFGYTGVVNFKHGGVVINCNFANNHAATGGGLSFSGPGSTVTGTIINSNFTNNLANVWGGAALFEFGSIGNFTNCNFVNNSAKRLQGGAVYIFDADCRFTNCTFVNNTASSDGGSIFFGHTGGVTNCYFEGNSGETGGAIFSQVGAVTVDSCIFKTASDTIINTHNFSPTLNVDNFTTVHNSGEKLIFDLRTNSSMQINNGNISIMVYHKNNNSWIGNYSCLSGDGWNVNLPVGFYYAVFNTEYREFKPITRTITVTAPKHTFWSLNYTINGNNDSQIDLTNDYHFDPEYDAVFVDGIVINRPVEIKGNGCKIDADGKARIFKTESSDVVLENIIFKNANTNGNGAAVYFNQYGRILNCNFTNNKADYGGAIWFTADGTVTDCNFAGNYANYGAAIYFNSSSIFNQVTNCNFTDNKAEYNGVVYFLYTGTLLDCNFTKNSASINGGAAYFGSLGTAMNCNFTGNKADYGGALYFKDAGEVLSCSFADNQAEYGGAVNMHHGSVSKCSFIDNSANEGGAIIMVFGTVEDCIFTNNSAKFNGNAISFRLSENTPKVINCNFTSNKAAGYSSGGAVFFANLGNVSNCNFVNNTGRDGGAVRIGNGSVSDCSFTNNSARQGGAIYFYNDCHVTNSNFAGNNASTGSAIFCYNPSAPKIISNSIFLNNKAEADKNTSLNVTLNENNITIIFTANDNLLNAIYSRNNAEITFTNVTYWSAKGIANTGSSPTTPSRSNQEAGQNITVKGVVNGNIINAVYITDENGKIVLENIAGDYWIFVLHDDDSYYTEAEKTFSNMNLTVNVTSNTTTNRTVNITAKSNIYSEVMPGNLIFILPDGTQINATYGANGTWWVNYTFDEYAIYQVNASYVGLDNVTVRNGTITINKVNSTITLDNITLDYGESINVTVATTGAIGITAKIGESEAEVDGFAISIPIMDAGNYTLTVTTLVDEDHNPVTKTVNLTVNKVDSTLTVDNFTFDYNDVGLTNVSFTGADGVNASVVGQPDAVVNVNGTNITVSGLNAGTYTLTVTTIPDINHNPVTENATITVNKLKTVITGSAVTATYNVNKNLVITLKDSKGNPVTGARVTVNLKSAKTYTTDKNGQIKVSTKGLAPKTYTAKVTFNGNANHVKSTKDIRVTVKKATPKLTAKKKTFMITKKTKKYTVILKDNTGKPIKKAKVTLKIKGKTYKATTNSKGKATFKIKKLNKKGTYKAKVTYKGNKYYKKVSKKVKIKVKFKTVSKGSKDKATVKQIQRALKNKGYYLSYNGHYLKVDGKYHKYTKWAVKKFQKDKKLKVTGKVNEKTAKKLGII